MEEWIPLSTYIYTYIYICIYMCVCVWGGGLPKARYIPFWKVPRIRSIAFWTGVPYSRKLTYTPIPMGSIKQQKTDD